MVKIISMATFDARKVVGAAGAAGVAGARAGGAGTASATGTVNSAAAMGVLVATSAALKMGATGTTRTMAKKGGLPQDLHPGTQPRSF